jgi:hypothetical protein
MVFYAASTVRGIWLFSLAEGRVRPLIARGWERRLTWPPPPWMERLRNDLDRILTPGERE